ncbi:MAG: type I-E CRISPR-associated protein Cas7/Cse4/CasC [Chthoniobacteraceae bacterium]|nr:type I-E CRISPR-associated protein Cas7/Cse4/CasC [Chthoniobacteraceae bacterium]
MNLIELHILQSYPVSCLNRDDVGAPKSAMFGGFTRARLSSQCLKRAVRTFAREEYPEALFQGVRSRRLVEPFLAAFEKAGFSPEEAQAKTELVRNVLSKTDSKNKELVTTAVFLSPGEIEQIAAEVAKGTDPKKAAKKASRLDAADIALFGRMIANDASLNVEAAAMFSHALSTHEAVNDIDFYSAVDERKTGADEDAGAGMIGTLEFNSALYYRYVALNLDVVADASHLGGLAPEQRQGVVSAFLRSALLAIPGARKASMNAATRPGYVLGLAKAKGQPLQLINAFLKPTKKASLEEASKAMKEHYANLKRVWGIESQAEVELSETGATTLDQFDSTLTCHVA